MKAWILCAVLLPLICFAEEAPVATPAPVPVPVEIMDEIKAGALAAHPDDLGWQDRVIKYQSEAWQKIQTFLADAATRSIAEQVAAERPKDYSLQFSLIKSRIMQRAELEKLLAAPENAGLRAGAESAWPGNTYKQLDFVRHEIVRRTMFSPKVAAASPPPTPKPLNFQTKDGEFQTKFQERFRYADVISADAKVIVVKKQNAIGKELVYRIPAEHVNRWVLLKAGAQVPLEAFIDAKQTNSGKKLSREWESSWGSYIRRSDRVVKLDVSISLRPGYGEAPVFQYVFFADSTDDMKAGQKEIERDTNADFVLSSNVVSEKDTNLKAIGYRSIEGGRPGGWVLRIVSGPAVLAVAGSDEDMRKLGARREAFASLFGKAK